MKHKFSTRLLSLLLVIVTLAGLLIPASAASLSGSGTVRITQDGFGNYLSKSTGGSIGGGFWKYTSNDGLTGSAYCVNWGLTGVSPSKALTVQPYNRNPQTMGAFANGYPNRTLVQFKQLHPNDVRGIAQLTEAEYKYATQVAVWATCGQISVPGTSFTAGRAAVVQPTSDARQIRIFDSVKAILALSEHWTKYLYPGLTIRAEENQNIPGVEVIHREGLSGAADANQDGVKKETINGKEYYTRVMYVSSATTTWIDGYTTKVYSTDAPQGTIFTAENGSPLETVQENGATCYKVDTSRERETGLNANGGEYYGAFKVCIPVDNVADEGSFTIKATGGAAQFNLFLANNPSSTEQSYIISDPAYTTVEASAPFKWSKTGTEDGSASLEIIKTGPGGGPLEGAEFTLTGDRGTTVTGTSGPDGKVTWTGLPADEKFTLTETKAPEGCQPIAGMNVTLEAGRTSYLTVPNDTAKGFTVKKIDAQNRGSLQGAVFVFEQIDGDYKTTGTTGFDGQISFEGDELPYGSYRVWEQSPPSGYQKDTRIETVEWTGEKDVLLTFEDVRDGGHVIDTPPQTVYLSGEEQEVIHVRFGNSAMGSLLVKKVDASDGSPLSDVEFMVTTSDDTVVGDANGKFVTDRAGTFTVSGIEPGTSLVVKETGAKSGYLLDDTPQVAKIKAGQTVTLEFRNKKLGNLVIHKLSSVDKSPIEGAQFRITYADGKVVDTANGQLSSNGFYTSNKEGQIVLSGVTGTLICTEVSSAPGFAIDPETRTQTVVVNPGDDTQQLYFYNTPLCSLTLSKVDSVTGKPIPNTTFTVRYANGELIGRYTTGKDGTVTVSGLLPGSTVVAVETKVPDTHVLNPTPQTITLKSGSNAMTSGGASVTPPSGNTGTGGGNNLDFENDPKMSLTIRKYITGTNREPLAGVCFKVTTGDGAPVGAGDGTFYTNSAGEIVVEGLEPGTTVTAREVSTVEGFVLDGEPKTVKIKAGKTVYVQPGKTVEIEWANTPITGQIQVYKYAAEANPVTGDPAGKPLKGAVYEISEARSGRVVDYITTDVRGVAASKPLPLTRYLIKEVTAPAYYQLSGKTFDETLEYSGQIIKVSDYDKPANLKVTIIKTGNKQLMAGDSMRYDLTVSNSSNVALENFFWHDRFPTDCATAKSITTGTYNARLNYRITYKTNYNDYRVLASNLLSTNNYAFDLSAIPTMQGEVVTDVRLEFGKVPAGFASVTKPSVVIQTRANLANGYQVVNRADAGGQHMSQWETGNTAWVTVIVQLRKPQQPNLPKTGY